jgi:hypothetical protein
MLLYARVERCFLLLLIKAVTAINHPRDVGDVEWGENVEQGWVEEMLLFL